MQVFGDWSPDQANFNATTLEVAQNVFPKIDGYGPVFAPLAATASAFVGCINLWYVQKTDGTYATYGASRTAIKRFNADTDSWDDVSRLVGGPYGCPADDRWSATKFGSRLIFCQLGDVPQYIDIDSGTNAALLPGSPSTARFVTTMDDKVIFACLASNPQFVQWSDANDSEEYTTGLAGNAEFPDHGAIMGFFPHSRIVLLESGMRSIVSTGDIYSFSFPELTNEKGTTAPWSAVEYGIWLYYLSASGFYKVNASVEEPINLSDNRISNYFSSMANHDRLFQVQAAYDPFNPRVIWTYPTGDDEFNDLALIYDISLDKWSEAVFDCYAIARLATAAVSLEGGSDSTNLDAPGLPSLDSKIYQAGAPIFVIIDVNGVMSSLGGDTLEATLRTSIFEFEEDYRTRVRSVNFRAKKAGAATCKIKKMTTLDDDPEPSFGSAIPLSASGRFPANHDGAFHQFEFVIPTSDVAWTNVMGWSADTMRTGKR